MRLLLGVLLGALLVGCASAPKTPTTQAIMPRSILVLPPTNLSVEVDAPMVFLSTITRPLVERGYYVFPVAVVARLMRENGMHTATQMHQIPLDLLQKHTGAEAVLYVNIQEWGQKYQVLSSMTVVKASMKLVLTDTGETIWAGVADASYGSQTSSSLTESLIGAVVAQINGSLFDQTYALSRQANEEALETLYEGPLLQEARHFKGSR